MSVKYLWRVCVKVGISLYRVVRDSFSENVFLEVQLQAKDQGMWTSSKQEEWCSAFGLTHLW